MRFMELYIFSRPGIVPRRLVSVLARPGCAGEFGDKWHRISDIDPEIDENSQDLLNCL